MIACGTSMAAPHISGLAAKLWSDKIYYGCTATDIKSLMQTSAKKNPVTKVHIDEDSDGKLKAIYEKALKTLGANTVPGKYYSQLLNAWDGTEKVEKLSILNGDSPLTGLGIPKQREGLQQAQHLHILAPAALAQPRFQQPPQLRKHSGSSQPSSGAA